MLMGFLVAVAFAMMGTEYIARNIDRYHTQPRHAKVSTGASHRWDGESERREIISLHRQPVPSIPKEWRRRISIKKIIK